MLSSRVTEKVRSLSFSRRRRKPSLKGSPTSTSPTESTPTEGESECTDPSETDGPAASPCVLHPLCSELHKKHICSTSFTKGSAKRYFEVDDTLGVMYLFRGHGDMERRGERPPSQRFPHLLPAPEFWGVLAPRGGCTSACSLD